MSDILLPPAKQTKEKHKNTLAKDLQHGLAKEAERRGDFENTFGTLEKTGTYDNFDWHNPMKHFYLEHKERSIPFGKYDSLFFDRVKYDKYLELKEEDARIRCFIIWTCQGVPYIWEFKDQFDDDDNACFYVSRKMMDRRKGHGFRPQQLINVFNEEIVLLKDFKI